MQEFLRPEKGDKPLFLLSIKPLQKSLHFCRGGAALGYFSPIIPPLTTEPVTT
jgi:hypothetical protein